MKTSCLIILMILSFKFSSGQDLPSDNFKLYTNLKPGYQFVYPADWYIKTDSCSGKEDSLWLERLNIENFDGKIVQNLAELTADRTVINIEIIDTKVLYVKGLANESVEIKTIEDWTKYGFDGEMIHDKTAIEKHMSNIKSGTIGETELKLWQDQRPKGRWTEFVYNAMFYRIMMQSGSEEQLQKDLQVYKDILQTFKLE